MIGARLHATNITVDVLFTAVVCDERIEVDQRYLGARFPAGRREGELARGLTVCGLRVTAQHRGSPELSIPHGPS